MTPALPIIFQHDFDDGFGPVDAYRHSKGNGIVAKSSQVHPDANIHETATVGNLSFINANVQLAKNVRVKSQTTLRNCVVKEATHIGNHVVIGRKNMPLQTSLTKTA